jgi:ABC-type antimicrobial peptide transport system permease subunit
MSYLYDLQSGYKWIYTEGKPEGEQLAITAEMATAMQDELFAWIEENDVVLEVQARLFDNQNSAMLGEEALYTVVAVTNLDKQQELHYYNYLYFTDAVFNGYWLTQSASLQYYDETITSYVEPAGAVYNALFLPYNHSDAQTNQLYEFYSNKEFDANDTRVYLSCGLMWEIEMVDDLISTLSQVFLWIGIVLAIFAALLLSNFISVSINHKKREIGILRAVGARGLDVFKIFFSESFVITFICVFISIVGCLILCQILNTQIATAISATIFNFGFFSFASLLAIATLTAVLATFLPVWNAARKKPVDSIRAL